MKFVVAPATACRVRSLPNLPNGTVVQATDGRLWQVRYGLWTSDVQEVYAIDLNDPTGVWYASEMRCRIIPEEMLSLNPETVSSDT